MLFLGMFEFFPIQCLSGDSLPSLVMPGLVPGIHAIATQAARKAWMAGSKPGHDDGGDGSQLQFTPL
jgi:hypothetical protein